ncbi:hypothetical protein [Fusobacterium polymorphum]|jgi:hypothetical protein|uniref:hypothetical protein n=1 Tax=Fusobacterium nucleatum subsp. polymorphum TaxID=76857 RepID=UPI00300BCA5F
MADNKLDITNMIERSYNILSNFESKIQAFFESYKNVDTKIVEKETAFLNAKQELKQFMQEYKNILEATREEFKTELTKEQKQFIEIANANTKEVLNARKEELTEIMKQEEQKVLLKTEKVITILESFQDNINSKMKDILKSFPGNLENATQDYINNAILDIKEIGSTLKSDIEEYKSILIQELKKYKADTIREVENTNIELKKSTTEIKTVAENIKKDSDNINRYSKYVTDDYRRLNNNLDRINKGTVKLNYILSGTNNSFILKRIYILLFSIINVFFILRIIIPNTYKINFKNQLIMNIIIIAGAILIILSFLDLVYSIFLYFFGEEIKEDED